MRSLFVSAVALSLSVAACAASPEPREATESEPPAPPGGDFAPAADPGQAASPVADAADETTTETSSDARTAEDAVVTEDAAKDAATDSGPDTKTTDAASDVAQSDAAPIVPGAPTHPFGSHVFHYAAGSIRPTGDVAAIDAATARYYDAWKKAFLVAGCGAGRYYVSAGTGGGGGMSGGSLTVSEGHGYGMLATVLMAGHDPAARTIFDGLYAFFRDHPSVHSKDLMAWNQVTGCGDSPDGGNDSATDGDLDIAMALLLADAQWGSTGKVNYLGEGKKVIAAIAAHDLNQTTHLALLGDWALGDAKYGSGTRPSDFMIDHFRAYGAATGAPVWTQAVDAHWSVVSTMQAGYAASTGLVPDFVVATSLGSAKPAPGGYLEGSLDGAYSWNACRVPWRLGTDYLVSGDPRAKTALDKLNAWIRTKTGNDAAKIVDGYLLDGTSKGSSNEIAFLAPLGVAAMSDAKNQAWLDAIWKRTEAKTLSTAEYYGDTIKLLTMIVMSGNYWVP